MQDTRNEMESVPDVRNRYVRVTRFRNDGFVEFDFAIGDPDLTAELILARKDFDAFCALNEVQPFPPEATAKAEAAHRAYLYGGAEAARAS